jgi:hypothetical protein
MDAFEEFIAAMGGFNPNAIGPDAGTNGEVVDSTVSQSSDDSGASEPNKLKPKGTKAMNSWMAFRSMLLLESLEFFC